jgi:UDP-N-acetylmuramoylalanine--D-glutamate ligase
MTISFATEKILILGAGVTGKSVAKALEKRGALITLADDAENIISEFKILKTNQVDISEFSQIVISPGWHRDHPLLISAVELGIPIQNEIDLAWLIKKENAPAQRWVAVTGTNGKTTTVEMVAAMINSGGLRAIACGNVGDTVIDAVEEVNPYEVLVVELSSFQLHWCADAQFVAGAILNIAQDHLDWHGDFDSYANAKISLLERSQIAILNGDDSEVVLRGNSWRGKKVFYSLQTPAPGEIGLVEELLVDRAFVSDPQEAAMFAELLEVKPMIPHHVSNTLAAAALARSIGVSHEEIRSAILAFRPGRHRIESVSENRSINWINDSKATNPHAAAASLSSFSSIVWIAGGLAKGAQMNDLVKKTAKNVKAVILIGADAKLLEDAFIQFSPQTPRKVVTPKSDYVRGGESNSFMDEIVFEASQFATEGDVVLLAPACASMDQFLSYADRGNRFVQSVEKMVSHE